MELCQYLVMFGSSPRIGAMVIKSLQMIFESYFYYLHGIMEAKLKPSDTEVETLMMVIHTIIEILEQNGNVKNSGELQDIKKTIETISLLKKVVLNRVFVADIEYCLGLMPL